MEVFAWIVVGIIILVGLFTLWTWWMTRPAKSPPLPERKTSQKSQSGFLRINRPNSSFTAAKSGFLRINRPAAEESPVVHDTAMGVLLFHPIHDHDPSPSHSPPPSHDPTPSYDPPAPSYDPSPSVDLGGSSSFDSACGGTDSGGSF